MGLNPLNFKTFADYSLAVAKHRELSARNRARIERLERMNERDERNETEGFNYAKPGPMAPRRSVPPKVKLQAVKQEPVTMIDKPLPQFGADAEFSDPDLPGEFAGCK